MVTREEFEKLEQRVEGMRRAEQSNKDKAVKGVLAKCDTLAQQISTLEQQVSTLERQLAEALEIITYERIE
jgi:outer membrane murein-binding lipoprotein Lpp